MSDPVFETCVALEAALKKERERSAKLVESVTVVAGLICRPISMTDAESQLGDIERNLLFALAAYAKEGNKI